MCCSILPIALKVLRRRVVPGLEISFLLDLGFRPDMLQKLHGRHGQSFENDFVGLQLQAAQGVPAHRTADAVERGEECWLCGGWECGCGGGTIPLTTPDPVFSFVLPPSSRQLYVMKK
jgi:hypothetical protein